MCHSQARALQRASQLLTSCRFPRVGTTVWHPSRPGRSPGNQSSAQVCVQVHARACLPGAPVTQNPSHLCSGAIAGNPLGVDRELLRAGEAPCPSFPRRPPSAPARSRRHTLREGRGPGKTLVYYLWPVRLERQGEAMREVHGAGETQGSRLPPGTCTKDLPNLLPLPTPPP